MSPKTPRAKWNDACDVILVDCLFNQRADGKQTANGGFHVAAWTAAKVLLAGTEAHSKGSEKTVQSCQNRYGSLKKEYKEVKHIRGLSGFGWNQKEYLVTAEESVWNALLAAHPSYAKWRTTRFPLFDEMADLIEGTYATGKGVVRAGDDQSSSEDSNSDSDGPHGNDDIPIDPLLREDSFSTTTSTTTPSSILSTASSPSSAHAERNMASVNSVPRVGRMRHNRRKSGSQAMEDVASSINRLADAVSNDASVPSPARKRSAIHMIEDDGDLSDSEQIKVIKMIRKDTSFADTILAIRKADSRTRYIKSELYPVDEDSFF